MHRNRSLSLVLVAFALLRSLPVAALELDTNAWNRFSVSASVGFNLRATFKDGGTVPFTPMARTTPNGGRYNYDNGYVLTDASGNAGGQTTYWGYDNAGQIAGNTIQMSRTTLTPSTGTGSDMLTTGESFGGEAVFNRLLFTKGEMRYGFELAGSYFNVALSDNRPYSASVSQTTDAYSLTPGLPPPGTPPAYQGTFTGPGYLLGSTPVGPSTTTVIPGGATVNGTRKYQADVFGLRLGPSVEFPVFEVLQLTLSGGFAVALASSTASWNETATFNSGGSATSSGSGSATTLLYGGYLAGHLAYQVSRNWSAEIGVMYQNLGTYEYVFNNRAVDVDFSKSIFVTFGVGYSF